jgi:hypothetical protein
LASCTRFSPNIRCPASITGEIADASNVFDTAINFTVSVSRRASLQARAISCFTVARPFGEGLVVEGVISGVMSARLADLRDFVEFYQVRERLFETFALPCLAG